MDPDTPVPESASFDPGGGEPTTLPDLPCWRLRIAALIEVLACSGFPTQVAIGGLLALFGVMPFDARGHLSPGYVFTLSLLDAAALVALCGWFLHLHGERLSEVALGRRPLALEALIGVLHVPLVFFIVIVVFLGVQRFVPTLHDVTKNPFQGLIGNAAQAALFAVVAVVGGGVREEVQRAFILHRFRQYLGGGALGLIVSSVAFGLGHLIQGSDAALATAVLGAFWGYVYLRRGSIGSTVVSHSGFNAAEILRYTLYGA
ncbi:MAG TPA: CPBP family intramembrane glutamic endopeptidase [Vicinamibacterales bacterium]|jgi:membrane protease YdiL (CAAX protease family)